MNRRFRVLPEALQGLQSHQKNARSRGLRVVLGGRTEASRDDMAAARIASLADCADIGGRLLPAEDPFNRLVLKHRVVLPTDAARLRALRV